MLCADEGRLGIGVVCGENEIGSDRPLKNKVSILYISISLSVSGRLRNLFATSLPKRSHSSSSRSWPLFKTFDSVLKASLICRSAKSGPRRRCFSGDVEGVADVCICCGGVDCSISSCTSIFSSIFCVLSSKSSDG